MKRRFTISEEFLPIFSKKSFKLQYERWSGTNWLETITYYKSLKDIFKYIESLGI